MKGFMFRDMLQLDCTKDGHSSLSVTHWIVDFCLKKFRLRIFTTSMIFLYTACLYNSDLPNTKSC